MKVSVLLCTLAGGATLSGCQLMQHQPVSHHFHDPVPVHDYQLPIYPQGMEVVGNYRQDRNQSIWYWSELANPTLQRGENLIVQIIANKPISVPPAQFAFALPTTPGERKYNSVGAYQRWVSIMPNGDRCTFAEQHAKRASKYLSVFIHYCTTEEKHSLTWLDELRPSFFLEEL
ncbi:hypothetical protein ACFFLZ_03825 [Photobacterium aphoticum]|nr:hypothetical protein [Photobacterium aphoticum]PSU56916.1 hypothetical protein C9I90_11170 [Photobacterium aphoticum]GHA64473.1 hypothetical protein GCM10007086_42700 [Photobacterium aphoticum]